MQILNTFQSSVIILGSYASSKNMLKPKNKPTFSN